MFLGLRSLIFSVPHLAEAKAWYIQVLDQQPYFDEVFYVGFNIKGYELGLKPEYEPVIRGNTVDCYWGVPNIQEAFQRLTELGALAQGEIQNVGGEIELAEFNDPWGNRFGIIYNPDFQLPT